MEAQVRISIDIERILFAQHCAEQSQHCHAMHDAGRGAVIHVGLPCHKPFMTLTLFCDEHDPHDLYFLFITAHGMKASFI